jgi:hypothetical protein
LYSGAGCALAEVLFALVALTFSPEKEVEAYEKGRGAPFSAPQPVLLFTICCVLQRSPFLH